MRHIENPAAYDRAIKERMIRNGIKGRMARMAEEHPMLLRLINEVIQPAHEREHAKWQDQSRREAEREGWDFVEYECDQWLRFDQPDLTAGHIASLEWDEMEHFTFPQQLVYRYLKTRKGLSPKQEEWVTRMVEEEPQREQKAQERQNARAAANAASTHVGAVKDRLKDVEVTVEFAKTIEGLYGSKRIVKMRDADGNLLVTFATSEWVWGAEKGATYTLTGTVKEHSEYEGAKQTVLTRTKATQNGESK